MHAGSSHEDCLAAISQLRLQGHKRGRRTIIVTAPCPGFLVVRAEELNVKRGEISCCGQAGYHAVVRDACARVVLDYLVLLNAGS